MSVALAWSALAAAATDEERILRFSSDIAVNRDGTLTVRETIAVDARGHKIVHGIFRDLPLLNVHVGEVTRDGAPEPFTVDAIDGGRRVQIGDPKAIVPGGEHVYAFTYETGALIDFFPSFDELNWNVTGTGWEFPVERAEAVVHLPPGAEALQSAFYTGPAGAKGKDAKASADADGTIRVRTTKALKAKENLTVAVGFTKGIIQRPTFMGRVRLLWRDLGFLIEGDRRLDLALAGLAAILVMYTLVWFAVGRDPPRGAIVPLFDPPEGLSPACVRYLRRMDFDRRTFVAALISLAAKGYATISETEGIYTLRRTQTSASAAGLDAGEHAVADVLFGSRAEITLAKTNRTIIQRAENVLSKALRTGFGKRYFVMNVWWFRLGLAIAAASVLASAILENDDPRASFMLIGGLAIAAYCLYRPIEVWQKAVREPGRKVGNVFHALPDMFIWPLVFLGLMAFGFWHFRASPLFASNIVFAAECVVVVVFHHLLKRPTLEGVRVRDAIDGFRLYLNTAEKHRLEVLNPPQLTPEVFERYLPYAIALDAENAWSRRFEAQAVPAGDHAGHYRPSWYTSSGSRPLNLGPAALAGALAGSVASATAASSGTAHRAAAMAGAAAAAGSAPFADLC